MKIDDQRREIEAQRQAINDEKQRLADIEAKRLQAIEMEKAKARAAENARDEMAARLSREAAEKWRAEKAQEAARIRAEALRPDKEKLSAVAAAVGAIVLPSVSKDAEEACAKVSHVLEEAEQAIYSIVEQMA